MKRFFSLLAVLFLISVISIANSENFKVDVSTNGTSFKLGESITWTLTPKGGTPAYSIRIYGVKLESDELHDKLIYTNTDPLTNQYKTVTTNGEPVSFTYTPTQITGNIYLSWDAMDSENKYDGGNSEKVSVTGDILPVTATLVPDKTRPQIGEDISWTVAIQGGTPPYEITFASYTLFHNSIGIGANGITVNENEPLILKHSANINGPLEFSIGIKDQSGIERRFTDTDSVKVVDQNGHTHEIEEEILEYGYKYNYGFDEKEHWMTCKSCGETFNHEEHFFTPLYYDDIEYCMACGYERKTKEDIQPGDVNGDGNVDGRDLLRLARYIAGTGVDIDASAADMNGDGNVDGRDVLRLAKQLAGG